jgi:hypothetical protein
MVEHLTFNQRVVGSSPTRFTNNLWTGDLSGDRRGLLIHLRQLLNIVGSSPTRSSTIETVIIYGASMALSGSAATA